MPLYGLPHIETERLILRMPNEKDAPKIVSYLKDNKAHFSATDPIRQSEFYTEEFWKQKIATFKSAFLSDQGLCLYSFDKAHDHELVGTIEFSQIARGPFQACYLGYGIAAQHEGKGLMFEALKSAIQFAFVDLNVHRIMANHLLENLRSARLLERLGFRKEGVAKEYLRIKGIWQDHVLNSLTNPNWKESPTADALAAKFASLMDQNRYYEAARMMNPRCRYIYQDKIIEGIDNIIQTYVSNFESASKQLDEIQFESEVQPETSNNSFKLKYLDRIRKDSSWFEHRCEQRIIFADGKVIQIEHFDLPGEPEKLKQWFAEMGIKR